MAVVEGEGIVVLSVGEEPPAGGGTEALQVVDDSEKGEGEEEGREEEGEEGAGGVAENGLERGRSVLDNGKSTAGYPTVLVRWLDSQLALDVQLILL